LCSAKRFSARNRRKFFSNRDPERLTCTRSWDLHPKAHDLNIPICTFGSPKHFYVHSPIVSENALLTVVSPTPIRHAEARWHSQWTLRSLHERFYCSRNWRGRPRRNGASVMSHVRLDQVSRRQSTTQAQFSGQDSCTNDSSQPS
jgi:hypothetical protein